MKLRSGLYLKDREGAERIRERFMWYPMRFDRYWYWLRRVRVVERITKVDVGGHDDWGNYAWKWCINRLAEEE